MESPAAIAARPTSCQFSRGRFAGIAASAARARWAEEVLESGRGGTGRIVKDSPFLFVVVAMI